MSDLTICMLASGSSGNCLYISTRNTRILVDAGLSARETAARLSHLNITPDTIHGICLTHEHSDHITGLKPLHNRYRIPLFANAGTAEAIRTDPSFREIAWQIFENGSAFFIGDMRIEAFSIPHDAADPVGYVIETQNTKVAVAMDMGMPTELIRTRLRGCRVLLLESNHDEDMLNNADRPWSLKQRIKGRQGHLSNQALSGLLADVAGNDLTDVFLCHLSAECNRPDLALAAARAGLSRAGCSDVRTHLTFPDKPGLIWQSVLQPDLALKT